VTTAYVDGNAGFSATSPFTLAIPADVAAGQIVLVYASVFANNTQVNLSGSVNTPVQLYFSFNGVNDSFMAWAFKASSADAGASLVFTEVGQSTYIGGIIHAYSGAGMPTVAYANGGFSNTSVDSWPAPSLPAPVAGCWGVYFITAGVGSGDGTATYAGGTTRQQDGVSGVNSSDSNGVVGNAGTTIGGGLWTTQATGSTVGVTVALPPPAATPTQAASAGIGLPMLSRLTR
jgi:hypothetical protein